MGMDDDGLFFYNLYVRKMSRRNLSFGLLLGAVAARASCCLRCGPGAPKLGLLQSLRRRGLLKPSYLPARAPCLNCYSLSARAPCLNGRVELQNPIVWTAVQLLPTRLGVLLVAWAAQCDSTL